MVEAWGRGFEKIKEACGLYNGPLPEYEINESGIMVLCKACDRYLALLRDDGQHHVQSEQDSEQDVINRIVKYCREPRTTKEIVEYFGFTNRLYFKRHYLDKMLADGILNMTIPEKPTSKNQKYYS